jgi:hypothetical protein
MKVEFLRSFERDLRGLNDPAMKRRLLKLIDDLERSDTLEGLGNVKRLVGTGTLTAYAWGTIV